MPVIEISQRAFDALTRETERFNTARPADGTRAPATPGELASDFLTHYCERGAQAEDTADAESIPF